MMILQSYDNNYFSQFLCRFCQVGLGQLHYQGGRGVEMDHGVSIYELGNQRFLLEGLGWMDVGSIVPQSPKGLLLLNL